MRYTVDMVIRCRTLLGMLLVTATLHAVAGDLVIGRRLGAYYGVPLAGGIYDPWVSCTSPYRCRDPVQMRLELERDLRMQELRERATQTEQRIYGSGDGPWGPQRYIPPATPEANIMPAYRGTSQLRPEYERTAKPINAPATESLK
jgi:hypothetical protein